MYNAIKNFAEVEQNQPVYLQSNLVLLMNDIVQDRRGDIFAKLNAETIQGQATGSNFNANPAETSTGFRDRDGSPDAHRRTGTLKKSIMANSFAPQSKA